jgi:hypothetical protein
VANEKIRAVGWLVGRRNSAGKRSPNAYAIDRKIRFIKKIEPNQRCGTKAQEAGLPVIH